MTTTTKTTVAERRTIGHTSVVAGRLKLPRLDTSSVRTLAAWTHWGPALALGAGLIFWPLAMLALGIPLAMLLVAQRRQDDGLRQHALAATNYLVTTLVAVAVLMAALGLLSVTFPPLLASVVTVGVLAYLAIFLFQAGLAAARGVDSSYPFSVEILR